MKYFAYGSNMAAEVVARLAPGSVLLGAARLPDHRLAFTRRSVRTGTGVADAVPALGEDVWGALYEMPERAFEELDRKEGSGWAYRLVPVRVELADTAEMHDAVAYTVIAHDADHVPPSRAYLRSLIDAARALGLPGAYVEIIRRMANLSGRCLCGNVTYSVDSEPLAQAICHCSNCQRQAGTAFSVVIAVPTAAFHVEGETLSSFETRGDLHESPTVRHFCSNCGSPIYSSVADLPDVIFLKAGTLDDASWVEPSMEVFTASAQPWSPHIDGAAQFVSMPGA